MIQRLIHRVKRWRNAIAVGWRQEGDTGYVCIQRYGLFKQYRERRSRWRHTIEYNADSKYKPQDCDKFCPYADKCKHGKNILTTAKPKRNLIERIPGYQEEFCSLEEMQEDVYNAILRAYHAEDTKVHVIKAGVGSGRS